MVRVAGLLMILVSAFGAVASAGQTFIAYPSVAESKLRPSDDCERYLHEICKNWKLAEWLPSLTSVGHQTTSTNVAFMDGFEYEGSNQDYSTSVTFREMPADGTGFTYGTAGPPTGLVVYDHARHVAFYGQGCCSWQSTVLAGDVAPPPLAVSDRSLVNVRTTHNIRLGQSLAQLQAVYGKSASSHLRSVPGVTLYSYVHSIDGRTCEQDETFGFFRDRLEYIDLSDAC